MRRVVVTRYGGLDALQVLEEELPEPARGEVRVQVRLSNGRLRAGNPAPYRRWCRRRFDGIGGSHIWRSRDALRPGGTVVAYGLTGSLRGGRLASGQGGRRRRLGGVAIFGLYIAGGWLLPGRKRVVPYSIQWLERVRPSLFRQDLITLFGLLGQGNIRPLIARRFALPQARDAQEFLGKGGVTGKVVLVCNEAQLGSGAA
jgi:NADPH2:quinone reductase